jgi:hypothetical protein
MSVRHVVYSGCRRAYSENLSGPQRHKAYQISSKSVQKFSYSIKRTQKSLQRKISPYKSEYTYGNKMSWLYGTESFNPMTINAHSKPIESTKNFRSCYFRVHFNIISPSLSRLPKTFSTGKNDISHCAGVWYSGFITTLKRSKEAHVTTQNIFRDQVPHPAASTLSPDAEIKNLCFQAMEF